MAKAIPKATPKATQRATPKATPKTKDPTKKCGLCGKTGKLTRTECCGQWICDDTDQYVPFSYARNSCYRNHDRYTLCGSHHQEGHEGDWRTCQKCRDAFKTEMYVWYGTNEYNFVKLEDPPAFEPTMCSDCGKVIRLSRDAHSVAPSGEYFCGKCTEKRFYRR